MTEADYRVELSAEEAACIDPGGRRNAVSWRDLQSVRVVTTGAGPFAPDVFWVLEDAAGKCVVPLGATGEPELLERLQALPGFNNEAFIKAMGSAEDASFTCWGRGAARRGGALSWVKKLARVWRGARRR